VESNSSLETGGTPPPGVRQIWGGSRGLLAGRPVVSELAAERVAAEGDEGVSAADCAEHPGLFEAAADDSFAAGFDHSRPNKQLFATELGIAHAVGILLQVVGLLADRIDGFRLTIDRGANRVDQLSDQQRRYFLGRLALDRFGRFFPSGVRTSSTGRARQIFSLTSSNC